MAQSRGQKRTVARVMRERKRGTLKSGSGRKVTSRKQAIAIAMSESGQSRNRRPKAKTTRAKATRAKTRGKTVAKRRSASRKTGPSKTGPSKTSRARRRAG